MSEKPFFAAFSGGMDNSSNSKIFATFAAATQEGFTEVHLLFQSGGGFVGDGVALYNFFRGYPLPIHAYNVGTVASAAVLAFLGAPHRYVSDKATILIHKTFMVPPQAPHAAGKLVAWVRNLSLDDTRSEEILRKRAAIPDARWGAHSADDVVFDAAESVQFGLAQAVREWQVPAGHRVFNI